MIQEQRYKLALSFWTLAFQYLVLVENASRETVSQDNNYIMVQDFAKGVIAPEEFEEKTRWGDHKIIVSLLFNLLHGIELLVKGFILADPAASVLKSHKIADLCDQFNQLYPEEEAIRQFIAKYTSDDQLPQILQRFLKDNNLTVDRLYQALRYPSDDFSMMRDYASLKYQGEDGTPLFKNISDDVRALRIASVRLGRSLDPNQRCPVRDLHIGLSVTNGITITRGEENIQQMQNNT